MIEAMKVIMYAALMLAASLAFSVAIGGKSEAMADLEKEVLRRKRRERYSFKAPPQRSIEGNSEEPSVSGIQYDPLKEGQFRWVRTVDPLGDWEVRKVAMYGTDDFCILKNGDCDYDVIPSPWFEIGPAVTPPA